MTEKCVPRKNSESASVDGGESTASLPLPQHPNRASRRSHSRHFPQRKRSYSATAADAHSPVIRNVGARGNPEQSRYYGGALVDHA